MNRKLCIAAFCVGALAVVWVAVGYLGSHPLALMMTTVIGAVYGFGALELLRFHQATTTLHRALGAIPAELPSLGAWLETLHPSLQNPVRLRVEGERVGLPAPTVTPYLVGLLVMLGMLGTFLGMVVTLNGAVLALETTTDLPTIRAALASPVKGLGLAFGTSVAGVAASAMLGLISALCRRERLLTSQLLDTRIATVLRGFSLTHQRQETFKALQVQAQVLPEVVDRLQAMMEQMAQQNRELSDRLLAGQESFHRDVKGVYTELASAVDQSLRDSLTESARLAGASIQPAVEATMNGIARETTALQARVADSVQAQLDGLAARFDGSVSRVTEGWTAALAHHEQTSEAVTRGVQGTMASFADSFAQRSADLLATVREAHAGLVTRLAADLASVSAELAQRDGERAASLSQSLESLGSSLQQEWRQAGAQALAQQQELCRTLEQTARDIGAAVQTQASQTIAQQQELSRTLEQTARDIGSAAQVQASQTIDEVSRLMQAAAEAPKAAAEVIGQLREELSNSVVRDNALLEERSRLMETLGTLLAAINHAAAEQRGAIDALVASSAAMLEKAGGQFAETVAAESAKISERASEVAGSAVEVASLGDAFGQAVQLFGESNDKLVASLQRIEGGLEKSMARSDEQLAYYVAQAREIIDLSIMSQKQVVDELQQLAGRPASVGGAEALTEVR